MLLIKGLKKSSPLNPVLAKEGQIFHRHGRQRLDGGEAVGGGGVFIIWGTKIAKAVANFYPSLCGRKPSPSPAFNYTCDPPDFWD